MKVTNKEFDCVEMKYDVQKIIYSEIETMNWEDRLEYFHRLPADERLAEFVNRLKANA